MNAIFTLILGAIAIYVGYGIYARSIDRGVIQPDPDKATPARLYMDGVDFTPTSRNVLFGYQFKSIAALGPIVGPIVAAQWGWLPALLWILLGTFFIGWVQDYASGVMAMREDGKTFGALSYTLVSPRARTILLIFIYCYLWLIMGAFGKIVGYDLMTKPTVPLGILFVILMGLLAGQMTYRWKQDIILTTVITVVVSFIGIWLGTLGPIQSIFAGLNSGLGDTGTKFFWSFVVLVICYVGSVLPIWRWAQPINFVSFWIVALGMLGGVIGMLIWHPGFGDFPAFTSFTIGIGPLWPILFVTIACGAISGWHSLVSSSGTARQYEKETDALPVGGGAMFMEMALAVIALLTATAAYGSFGAYKEQLAKGGGSVFAVGLAKFLGYLGIPQTFGVAYGSVFLTIMAMTIMYLVVRFMRVASAEFLGDQVPVLRNVHIGTAVACVLSLILIWTGFWQRIWVLFGGSNQLMASLALFLVTIWLIRDGRPMNWTLIPAIFMYVTTIAALIITGWKSFAAIAKGGGVGAVIGNLIAGILAVVLIVCALILAWDGWQAIQSLRARRAEAS